MAFIADVLLMAGALGAGFYCHVLARRLRRFTDLEKGVGGAVAVLSAQVDDLGQTLRQSQGAAAVSVSTLEDVSARAETAARHLELLVASLHDLPEARETDRPMNPFFVRRAAGGEDRV